MFDIFVIIVVFIAGMLVAWNVAKQPAWVENLYNMTLDGVKNLYKLSLNKVKKLLK